MVLILLFKSDPDEHTHAGRENDHGVSFTSGADVVNEVRAIELN
jgi:hypothetical protein